MENKMSEQLGGVSPEDNEKVLSRGIELTSSGLTLEPEDIETELQWSEIQSGHPELAAYLQKSTMITSGSKGSFHWNPSLRFLWTRLAIENVPRFYIIKPDSDFGDRYLADRAKRHDLNNL